MCSSASAAEVLFASLKNPSVRACCTMIRGYAKAGFLFLFKIFDCMLCCKVRSLAMKKNLCSGHPELQDDLTQLKAARLTELKT